MSVDGVKWGRWTTTECKKLTALMSENKYFFTEIAEKLGRCPKSVRYYASKLGLGSTNTTGRHGKWNQKHNHLREPVLKYFLTHTMDETRKHFKLTISEIKSLFTVAYRMPEYKHLRKDKRRHDAWSGKEFQILLTHSGLIPRGQIAKKLKRGKGFHSTKERMEMLNVSSRALNGLTLSQFRKAFGADPAFKIQTVAGPYRGGIATRFKLIPWVWLNQELKAKRLKAPKIFIKYVGTMAMFQEWIYQGDVLNKMNKIILGARRAKG